MLRTHSAHGLEDALDSIAGAFVMIDRDWRFTFVNAYTARNAGMRREDMEGRNIWELFPGLENFPIAVHYRRAMNDRDTVPFEETSPLSGRVYEGTIFPMPDGIAASWHDITDRKQAEKALRESEARLRAIADSGLTGLFEWDMVSGNMYWSDHNFRALGLTPSERTPSFDLWMTRVHDQDRAGLMCKVHKAREGHTALLDVHRVLWDDGSLHVMECRAAFVYGATGECVLMRGTYVDVTELKRLEARERDALVQAQFRSLFESVPGQYVVVTPSNFEIVAVSDAYLASTNTARAELLGRCLIDTLPATEGAGNANSILAIRYGLERAAQHGQTDVIALHQLAVAVTNAEGVVSEERWWSRVSAPVFALDGSVAFIIHRAEDVTPYVAHAMRSVHEPPMDARDARIQQMAVEIVMRSQQLQSSNEQLRAHQEDLRAEVAERKQLEQVRGRLLRQLVSAQEAERQRLSRELHDSLGQHLTALGFRLESLARMSVLSESASEQVAHLQTLAGQIDQEVNRLAHELRPSALDDLGLEAALRRHVQMWATDAEIEVDIHTRGLELRMSEAVEIATYRVVQEALTNVRKHSRATHASVVVERRAAELRAIIEDNGAGMVHAATQAASVPRLGITTMNERATLLGGELHVETSQGGGVTVYFRVPIHG